MKKKLANLSLTFCSFIFALLLAEVIVRIFIPQTLQYNNEGIWRPDSRLGWRHNENINMLVNFGASEITFRTDQDGYRVNADGRSAKDTSSLNVLVLGDSFLEAVQVNNRQTIPELLEEELNVLPRTNTQFYNSSVAGWNPNHYFLEGQRVLEESPLEVDHALVFLYLGNDIIKYEEESFSPKGVGKRAFRMPRSFSGKEFVKGIVLPASDYLDRNSQLYMLIKTRNARLLTRMGLSSRYFPVVFKKNHATSESWEVTSRVCKKIQTEFEKYNIPVKFVLIPTTYQVDAQVLNEYVEDFDINPDSVDMEQPNKILSSLFTRDSLTFYDPLEYLREKAEADMPLYGKIDAHFNAQGHKVMAEYLLPILTRELKGK